MNTKTRQRAWPIVACLLVACAVVLLVACGGGGDDPPPAQPGPPLGSSEAIVVDSTSTRTVLVNGPSVNLLLAGFGGPAFTLPAGTTSAEACVNVRWAQDTGGPAALTMETAVSGIAGGDLRLSAAMDLPGPGSAMLEADRCGAVDIAAHAANPGRLMELSVRVTASNPAMYRYTATLLWTVKARLV